MPDKFDRQYFKQINDVHERLNEHNTVLKALIELFMIAATGSGLEFRTDNFYGIARMIETFLEEQARIIDDEIECLKKQSRYAVELAENWLAGNVDNAEETIQRLEYVISCMGQVNEPKAVQLLKKVKSKAGIKAKGTLSNSFNCKTVNISQSAGA